MSAAADLRPFVSVIVPVRDEAGHIRACIDALLAQTYPASRLEVIAIDGASTDGTSDILAEFEREHPDRLAILMNPSGRTPEALNRGLAAARGDVIVRMDGHAAAPPDYVEVLVDALASTHAWCVGGVMDKQGNDPTQQSIAIASSSQLGVGNAKHNYLKSGAFVETVYLGAWPRWVLDRVGGFDEELLRNQDDELSFRIRAAGGQIWLDPRVRVRYAPRGKLGSLFDQYRQYGYWKVLVFAKHPSAARIRHLIPPAMVAAVTGSVIVSVLIRSPLPAAFVAGPYAAALAAGTMLSTARGARPAPAFGAFLALHFGYGIGFWQGMWAHRSRLIARVRPGRL